MGGNKPVAVLVVLVVCLVSIPVESDVAAATITVKNLNDSGPGSLRQAIANASPGDTIFAPGLTGKIILTSGELTISNDLTITGPSAEQLTISGNHSSRVFFVHSGVKFELSGVTVANGSANDVTPFSGGGLFNDGGTVTITNSTFSGNRASSCGGIYNAGTMTISNSTFLDNDIFYFGNGGSICNEGMMTITHSTIQASSAVDGGGIYNVGDITIIYSTISGNGAVWKGMAGEGGAIYNLGAVTITHSTILGNFAAVNGGGVYNGGSLALINSTLSDNQVFDENNGDGGGIYNHTWSTVAITDSTLSGNNAPLGGGISNVGTVNITNTTLSGNSATNSTLGGGGIFNSFPGTANISFVTIANNSADSGAGIFNDSGGTVNIKNSIVANRISGGNCATSGTFAVQGVNFATDGSCTGFTQATSAQLNLGLLTDNSGMTQTHALLAGSVAIDAITDCTDVGDNPVTTDQRGVARPQPPGGQCDVGAYELVVAGAGDVNLDGKVNILDARICLQFALGLLSPTADQQAACDVNGDGQLTQADAEQIAKHDIGLPNTIVWLGGGLALAGLLLGLGRSRRRRLWALLLLAILPWTLSSCGFLWGAGNAVGFSIAVEDSFTTIGETGSFFITVSGMPDGGLAALSVDADGLSWDPASIQITGITGVGDFVVLASAFDNATGRGGFALVNPAGGLVAGKVARVSYQAVGKFQKVTIEGTKVVAGDANNQPLTGFEVIPGDVGGVTP